jgi:DNA polymerase (family X)
MPLRSPNRKSSSPPSNAQIAAILKEISEYLAMGSEPFKTRAFERVSETIAELAEPVHETYTKLGRAGIEEIPGVGKSIADKIEEFLKTGKIKDHETLRKETPVDLVALRRVEGLGPKSIKVLYEKLGIKNLKDLGYAARKGRIRNLDGFGIKKEEKILAGIGFAESAEGRFLISSVAPTIARIEKQLGAVKGVTRVELAGSARRRKETIGDIDVLVISEKQEPVMEAAATLTDVEHVTGQGDTKTSARLHGGINLDVRVVPAESYGAALQYFTGSKDHNVAMREIAIKKGYKLNEYGLWKGEKRIAGKSEEEIYKALGLTWMEPEIRENSGEIEAARTGKLPKLIGYDDLMGDLQVQTDWTDGAASIEEMARAAKAQGLKYVAVTDHTKTLTIANGLDEKRIVKQWAEIDRVNKLLGSTFKVLKGTECDILKDGSLDLPDHILAKLDVVGVSVHSFFNLSEADQTERIIRAISNPHVDILFHPTGRIIGRRAAYPVDMRAIIAAAKKTGTVLEANALERLDLNDLHIRMAIEAGVKISIDSDSHAPEHFASLEYGIGQARRGWAEKKDVVNAWPLAKMLKFLKK